MKKLLTIILAALLLVGCGASDNSTHTGSYTLLKKGEAANLVVHWEFPDPNFQYTSYEIDTTNFNTYIDESLSTNNTGVNLNNLLGTLGFNKAFLSAKPIQISHSNVDKILKNKINIYLNMTDDQGNNYKVKLKYNKAISD